MKKTKKTKCTSNDIDELIATFQYINSEDLTEIFLRDLLTEEELQELAQRWKIVRMLSAGLSYKKIELKTGASSATIARAKQWLNGGYGSFRKIIEQIKRP